MITSLSNKTIKEIMKLKQKKYRDETGLFLIEGYHLVEEAKKAGCLKMVITTLDASFDEETLYVNDAVMEKLAFTKSPQPIMGVCEKSVHTSEIVDGDRYVLLDTLQDPGNIGTIMRTSLALGVDQLIMSKECVDLYNDKVIRATQGALFKLPVCVMDLHEAIEELKEKGVAVYGTCLQNAASIDTYETKEKMAFVMGNEGNGVSADILDICDHRVYIPISDVESLNVGIAMAITVYHFRK